MLKKHAAFLAVLALSSLLLGTSVDFAVVFGWSNGGFSADPSNPNYGTHDWIAHHALDWLPLDEKRFILDNVADYLYGTELPDNGGAPDGIGDTAKHHVYYFSNGSLQDDASAVRAEEEYNNAVNLFKNGDLANASKRLGIVSHYISDLAVFGHVMGSATDWGEETHHSVYENYVDGRTDDYEDEFNVFLVFDGALSNVSAYDAGLTLAHDTTFDVNGESTCVWMDQNYNWSDATFRSRCGESLNLAVNLIADVLHTFYTETKDSAHFVGVPFHYQDVEYYCGPACLEMVFDYYGEDVNQSEIADVARTIGEPVYSTFTDELRRAAHFSDISTSMGDEMLENITGYTLRKLGYAAFEAHDMNLTQLEFYIDQNKPLILLMRYKTDSPYGHYRVVTGYNETHVFLHDPWNKPLWNGTYGGPNIVFNYSAFLDLWSFYGNWALYTSPWTVNVSAPTYIKPETPFRINATITYPTSLPNTLDSYPASSCNATIMLPAILSLAPGETPEKTVGTGFLEAGTNSTVSWVVVANSSGEYALTVEVEGLISGSVGAHVNYSAYDYTDRIGATASFTGRLEEDNNAPTIDTPSRVPEGDVQPDQDVKVSVNITDAESGVENVTLFYTTNNGTTWQKRTMNYNASASLYEATIPGQPAGTWVRFKIVAYDNLGNNATEDGTEPYCAYQVVPEFPSNLILPLFVIIALATALLAKKRNTRKAKT